MRFQFQAISQKEQQEIAKKNLSSFIYQFSSLADLGTELIIAKNIGYLNNDKVFEKIKIIRKMLSGLINSLKIRMKNVP